MGAWQSVPVLGVGQVVTWAQAWDPIAENMADSGWLDASALGYTNSWVDASPVVQYRLIGNQVRFRGVIQNGSNNTAAFTLPALYRPTAGSPGQQFICFGGTFVPAYITISSAGVVTVDISGGSTAADFSNISYFTD